jgi:hypothetical protein
MSEDLKKALLLASAIGVTVTAAFLAMEISNEISNSNEEEDAD